MKIVVTGGTGFLGGALCRALKQQGYPVTALVRREAPELQNIGIEIKYGDLRDPDAVGKSLEGADGVIHCAARAGIWGNFRDYYEDNVTGTENIINGCLRHGVRKLVFTSSPSAVFDMKNQEGVDETQPYPKKFKSHYPHTKALAEQMALRANGEKLAAVALRPHLIWGPGDRHLVPRIVARAKAGKMYIIGTGKNKIDTIYIENAVDAHIAAINSLDIGSPIAGKAYFLTNGEPMETEELLNAILKEANLPPIGKKIPEPLAYMFGTAMELFYGLTGRSDEPLLTRFVSKELACSHWFNISAIRRDLGYSPRISIGEGLKKLGEWLRKNGNP